MSCAAGKSGKLADSPEPRRLFLSSRQQPNSLPAFPLQQTGDLSSRLTEHRFGFSRPVFSGSLFCSAFWLQFVSTFQSFLHFPFPLIGEKKNQLNSPNIERLEISIFICSVEFEIGKKD
jgi:hypothetical protein